MCFSRIASAETGHRLLTDSLPLLNQKAPEFSLSNLKGEKVSLASFKGKTVIISFWATWCVYCHKNFKGMQKAISHYQENPDVVFLFIDTRENGNDILEDVKKDISKNNYKFQVLLDEKGSDGKQNKYYKLYDMPGLPTRFIIDRQGIIRYKLEGHADWRSDDENAAEVVKLVDKIALKG